MRSSSEMRFIDRTSWWPSSADPLRSHVTSPTFAAGAVIADEMFFGLMCALGSGARAQSLAILRCRPHAPTSLPSPLLLSNTVCRAPCAMRRACAPLRMGWAKQGLIELCTQLTDSVIDATELVLLALPRQFVAPVQMSYGEMRPIMMNAGYMPLGLYRVRVGKGSKFMPPCTRASANLIVPSPSCSPRPAGASATWRVLWRCRRRLASADCQLHPGLPCAIACSALGCAGLDPHARHTPCVCLPVPRSRAPALPSARPDSIPLARTPRRPLADVLTNPPHSTLLRATDRVYVIMRKKAHMPLGLSGKRAERASRVVQRVYRQRKESQWAAEFYGLKGGGSGGKQSAGQSKKLLGELIDAASSNDVGRMRKLVTRGAHDHHAGSEPRARRMSRAGQHAEAALLRECTFPPPRLHLCASLL